MRLVVDSNIIISALINANGKEFAILLNQRKLFEFFSSSLVIEETSKRFKKISSLTRNSTSDIRSQFFSIIDVFKLITENEIRLQSIHKALDLIKGIDLNDYLFIAVAIDLDALLWTGDSKLFRGLRRKGFNNIVTTKELKQIIQGL